MTDFKKYVDELDISYPHYAYRLIKHTFRGTAPADDVIKDGVEQSFIVDKSIMSFVSGVTGTKRADILNSLLLAQLAANKQVPDKKDVMSWYKAYIDVLSNIGAWIVEQTEVHTYESSGTIVEVQNAIIGILTAAFGADYIAIIKKTLDAISELADGDGRITAFDANSRDDQHSCFQIGMAGETDGAVSLRLGTFMITTSETEKRILFIKFSKDTTALEYAANKATFNEDIYATIRAKVKLKLGDRASQYLDEIKI